MPLRSLANKNTARARRHLAAQEHLVYKLKAIRALWVTAHNTPQAVEKMEREFLFLVGEIVEGTVVEKLVMHNISRDAFLREFHDR
jgi:ABC-type phosphate transport system ATPase subunit